MNQDDKRALIAKINQATNLPLALINRHLGSNLSQTLRNLRNAGALKQSLPKSHYDFRDGESDSANSAKSWSEFTGLKWSDYVDNSAQSFNLGKGGDHHSHESALKVCLPNWIKERGKQPIATYFHNYAVGAIFPTN